MNAFDQRVCRDDDRSCWAAEDGGVIADTDEHVGIGGCEARQESVEETELADVGES